MIRSNVTNVGTVVGTPTDAYGHNLPGILGDVSDDDDAVVTVPPEPATIGDRVWADVDGDGFQDEGEPGLSDVTVTLKDSDGHVVASMTTDNNGEYLFEDVPAGSYTVVFTAPDNVYEFTAKDAGADDAADSDTDAAGVAAVTVGEGEVNLTIDADGVIEELSEGNNQLPAFAWLTPITLDTTIDAEGVLLSWNCYDGQTYTVLVSPLLSTTREPFTGVVEILDADGDVKAVTDGLAIPADPSGTLSIRIPTTENDVSGFFSLRVNILDDGSDIR